MSPYPEASLGTDPVGCCWPSSSLESATQPTASTRVSKYEISPSTDHEVLAHPPIKVMPWRAVGRTFSVPWDPEAARVRREFNYQRARASRERSKYLWSSPPELIGGNRSSGTQAGVTTLLGGFRASIRHVSKLVEMRGLKDGWDGYCAPPPSACAIENARQFLQALPQANLEPSRIKPSVVGGVGVTFKSQRSKAYVEFYNDGTVGVLLTSGQDVRDVFSVNAVADWYKSLIEKLGQWLGNQGGRDV